MPKRVGYVLAVLLITSLAVACAGNDAPAATMPVSPAGALGPQTLYLSADAHQTPDGRPITRDGPPWPFGAPWRTNWEIRTVGLEEITFVARRDAVFSLDAPGFDQFAAGDRWMRDDHPVIHVAIDGDARAFPLGIVTWHEIVNTTIGGRPIAVTYCPLCNTAVALERVLLGEVVEFGVSGLLRHSDLIMWDRTTESLWQQFTGEAIVGGMVGARLGLLSAPIVSWGQFKAAFPDGLVLSVETAFPFDYAHGSFAGYEDVGPFAEFAGTEIDPRVPATERVLGIDFGPEQVTYTFTYLRGKRVVNERRSGNDLVLFWTPGTVSALDGASFAEARDVGTAGVFHRHVEGRTLLFEADQARAGILRDVETGSAWDVFGRAVSGPLRGAQLTPVVHGTHVWFAWIAFFPETALVRE